MSNLEYEEKIEYQGDLYDKWNRVPKLTFIIFRLFIQNGKCYYCDKSIYQSVASGIKPEIDHVVPKSKGGLSTIDNLVLSCRRCNQKKKDKDKKEFLKSMKNEI